jgi:hypothetical protein
MDPLKAMQEIMETGSLASQEKMDAWIAEMGTWREETTACLESKEPTSLEAESVAVHQEVPKEEATVETFGALKKLLGDHI